jgi:hypothetical protein
MRRSRIGARLIEKVVLIPEGGPVVHAKTVAAAMTRRGGRTSVRKVTGGGALVAGLAALAALTIGLAGCARGGDTGASGTDEFTTVSAEGQALESMGFAPDDVIPGATEQDTSATPESTGTGQVGHRALRRFARLHGLFGRRVLHGEIVVQTQDGPKTLVVQRGTVTAINGSSLTIKSADGFELTWTLAAQVRVVINRRIGQPSAIAVGAAVGVAGFRDGAQPTARLVVEPKK